MKSKKKSQLVSNYSLLHNVKYRGSSFFFRQLRFQRVLRQTWCCQKSLHHVIMPTNLELTGYRRFRLVHLYRQDLTKIICHVIATNNINY